MFTGIIKGIGKIQKIENLKKLTRFGILFPPNLLPNLQIGASVAVNGVCLTVTQIEDKIVHFDLIEETLMLTNLKDLKIDHLVNLERSLCFGEEVGGHLLSGHIFGVASIQEIIEKENNVAFKLKADKSLVQYLFKKGYVALDGASLTLVLVNQEEGFFRVDLIPETLRQTTFSQKKVGDTLNVEVDYQTQVIIDTIDKKLMLLNEKSPVVST